MDFLSEYNMCATITFGLAILGSEFAFVAVALPWPAGRLPGVSSQRGVGQQRVITRYTSPPVISPKSSEYKMQLEDDRKKFGCLRQILMWILKNHWDCKFFLFSLRQRKIKVHSLFVSPL